MAYLQFDHQTARNKAIERGSVVSSSLDFVGFAPAERAVILLSRSDPWLSLADPHSLKVRLLRCLGYEMPNRLADARLETLRRHAVILRLRGPAGDNDLRDLFEAGFSSAHAIGLEQMVAPWRSHSRARSTILCWGFLGMVLVFIHEAVMHAVNEEMIALIIAGLAFVLLAPLVLPRQAAR